MVVAICLTAAGTLFAALFPEILMGLAQRVVAGVVI